MPQDRSGTITTGGTAQVVMPIGGQRAGFSIQNNSAATLYIRHGATATSDGKSISIVAGGYYESPISGYGAQDYVSVLGATTGQQFAAQEW